MRFGILGPVRAVGGDGRAVPLGGARLRALLAMLLLDAGRPVPQDRLVDGLYGDRPPAGAVNALQSQVSRLRHLLPVEFDGAGYRLAVDPDEVDVHRFARLAALGHDALAAGDHARAATMLREALALWRGEPLPDVRAAPFAAGQVTRLVEARRRAVEDRAEAELAGGTPRAVVGDLRDLVAADPLRERGWALLMRALAAEGRPAEALSVFAEARGVLAAELGTDPSPELLALHTAILRGAGGPSSAAAHPAGAGSGTETAGGASADGADRAHGAVPADSGVPIGGPRPAGRLGPAASVRRGVLGGGDEPNAPGGREVRPDRDVPARRGISGGSDGPRIAGVRDGRPVRDIVDSHDASGEGDRQPGRGLPEQLTSFIGRDDELRAIADTLTTARLVTLHGPGGSGKTRLAVESAARHRGEVRFAELAAATGADLPRVVADAVGLRVAGLRGPGLPDAGPGLTDRLVAALAGRELLLVLDNCEHVIGAAATFAARLLAGCPGVRVLATSREPLGVTGEVLRPIGGLPEPAAVRLFTERAALVAPELDRADDDAVRQICRTLDGLPLALELAAARLHGLPVAEVAARVGDRFRLLSRGSRSAPERQRTLRAVVEWSWDLLDEPERALARRFTVFRGGCGLAAIEAVCGLGPDTVDLLGDLVGKSLIERDGDRYRMLETIRAFCAERLDEAGETDELRRRHAEHFLAVARAEDPLLRGRDQLAALRRLDEDRDNVHAAVLDAEPETGLRLLAALSFYWWLRGKRAEAADLARTLLRNGAPRHLTEEYLLCVLTARLGATAGDEEWHARYLDSLTAPPAQPILLYLSAIVSGPPTADRDDMRRLHAGLRGDPWNAALAAVGEGWLSLLSGDHAAEAEREFRTALDGFRALGERWGTMLALNGLAELASARGDHAEVDDRMDAALALAAELGSVLDMADLLRSRAESRLAAGDVDGAAGDFTRTAELARQCGALELLSAALLGLGRLTLARGDHGEAKRLCEAALAECPNGWFGSNGIRATILAVLGRIAERDGDDAEAGRRFREVFTVGPGPEGVAARAETVEGLAGLAVRSGDAERAALLLGVAGTLAPGADRAASATEARALLGDDRFAAAHARGAAMTEAEAVALIIGG